MAKTERINAGYALSAGLKLAWFGAQAAIARRVAMRSGGPVARKLVKPTEKQSSPSQKQIERALFKGIIDLFRTEMANINEGLYPAPALLPESPLKTLRNTRRVFADLPNALKRQQDNEHEEPFKTGLGEGLPRYYRQNFHFQTDGWLSEDSAKRYETQVETLFTGTAAAMRRQGLAALVRYYQSHDQRDGQHLDIACGTASFLREIKTALPRLDIAGLDLSSAYIKHAQKMNGKSDLPLMIANAEKIPIADASLTTASIVFLLHEVPEKIRSQILTDAARVIKPGGQLIIVDSLQKDDQPMLNGVLENFPALFHEPYFANYLNYDFSEICDQVGFKEKSATVAHLAKVMVYDRIH